MIKIIIVAHGNFPDGILSSLELIAGHQEYVVGINFIAGMSSNDVRVALQREVIDFKEILVLTDLLGGTPFNVSSALSVEYTDKKIKVLSGLNLSMLMEAVLSRTM
ncbi:PTS sugar transporter subunit IIA, partial [Streptococcus anginosus]